MRQSQCDHHNVKIIDVLGPDPPFVRNTSNDRSQTNPTFRLSLMIGSPLCRFGKSQNNAVARLMLKFPKYRTNSDCGIRHRFACHVRQVTTLETTENASDVPLASPFSKSPSMVPIWFVTWARQITLRSRAWANA